MQSNKFDSVIEHLNGEIDKIAASRQAAIQLYEKAMKTGFASKERVAAALHLKSLRSCCGLFLIQDAVWNDLVSSPLAAKLNTKLICLMWSTACFTQGADGAKSFAEEAAENSNTGFFGSDGLTQYWYDRSVFYGPIDWFGVDIYCCEGAYDALTQELSRLGVRNISCTDKALGRICAALKFETILQLAQSPNVKRIEGDARELLQRPKSQRPPEHVMVKRS